MTRMGNERLLHAATLICLLIALTLASALTHARGGGQYGWLRDSPFSAFSEADWEMLRKNARKTLDEAPDGETSKWQNPDSGNSGSVTVMTTFQENGLRCRKAKFTNEARGMVSIQTHSLCKADDGTWKIAP